VEANGACCFLMRVRRSAGRVAPEHFCIGAVGLASCERSFAKHQTLRETKMERETISV
jgi:hypothetical protein